MKKRTKLYYSKSDQLFKLYNSINGFSTQLAILCHNLISLQKTKKLS